MEETKEALDTQAGSTELDYSNEEAVNAAAAKEMESSKTPVEQPSKIEVTKPDVAGPSKAEPKDASPKNTAKAGQPAVDAEKSYADLQKQVAETRKWATQMAQERAELRKELEAIKRSHQERASKESEQQDIQQLLGALQTQDPRALHAFLSKQQEALRQQLQSDYTQQLSTAQSEIKALKYDREVERRRADSKNYPNFNELEPAMMQFVNDGKVAVKDDQDIGEVIDTLYNLAKTTHSEDAIRAAEKSAYEKASSELAKEAKTAVAGGGKGVSTSPADLHKMPLDKLEQLISQMYGVANRD